MFVCCASCLSSFADTADKIRDLENFQQKLHEFDDLVRDLSLTLSKVEEKLEAHNDLATAANDSRHLETLKVRFVRIIDYHHHKPYSYSRYMKKTTNSINIVRINCN